MTEEKKDAILVVALCVVGLILMFVLLALALGPLTMRATPPPPPPIVMPKR
jgi:hypothetical protein